MSLIMPRGKVLEDESLGSFVRRRLGNEALERNECMDLDNMMSNVVYAYIKGRETQPTTYLGYRELIRKWIGTQQTAYACWFVLECLMVLLRSEPPKSMYTHSLM